MKKLIVVLMAALLITFIGYGSSMAGNSAGLGDGDGPLHDIFSGTSFDYSGVVVEMLPGEGLLLGTGSGNITIYGIGPASYWEDINVDRPSMGETIRVTGYTVNYDGIVLNIATEITIGDDVVQLRDADTGLPLWR